MSRYSLSIRCNRYMVYALLILYAMLLCACSPCADVRKQLDTQIPVCPPVGATVDVVGCGCDCADYEIDEHLMALDCHVWHTERIGCIRRVTMGSAEP